MTAERATVAAIEAARQSIARAQAELADLCVRYAEQCVKRDEENRSSPGAPRPGEFAADELSMVLRQQPWDVRCLLARTRRVRTGLPTVRAAARRGELDAEQVRRIDAVAKLAREPETVAVIDERVVAAACTRTPKQLTHWLQRLLAELEPDAAAHRHRVCFADRRVTIAQSVTGIGYVTGEVSAVDAAAIDGRLTSLARGIVDDRRSEQQRRSDLFAGLLLGTVQVSGPGRPTQCGSAEPTDEAPAEFVEVEQIDPDTGEYLGVTLERFTAEGEQLPPAPSHVLHEAHAPIRIGVVVPLSSVLGVDDHPGALVDRSATLPAEVVRELAARSDTLFTRLLTDDGGRLLDTTELGRSPSARLAEAVRVRAGTCRYPTCSVSAQRCDLDHHEPVPRGPTSGHNLDPGDRRHHRGKTFAGLVSHREADAVVWTLPTGHTYRCLDDPLPLAASP